MANALFYLMALLSVASALGVVLAKNPIQCVLSLLGSFFCLATIYLLAGFQFIAAAQILVYGGAIMVLFLFVIMLLNLGDPGTADKTDARMFSRPNVAAVVVVAALLLGVAVYAVKLSPVVHAAQELPERGIDTVHGLAGEMFGRYLLPFEAVSLLLLATAIAVVVLAKRERSPKRGAKS
ncbi:MAG: NADH-quinone oxidoreductase subunit J [Planctomycetes bacterium]|nr:NADH-quinone oxidoreductase subunit J [Planctomycetota bacterium]